MNLFAHLIKSKFDEIESLSNKKERAYLDLITQLKAEYAQLKEKSVAEVTRLSNELKKYKKNNA